MSVPMEVMEEEQEVQQHPQMTESEVIAAVDQEIRWATDLLQDDLSANRKTAWQYFKGERPGALDDDIDEYFQTIVSRDVADVIESTLAEILPAFATERPAEFDSAGPGDEDQAALESDIVNDQLMEAGNGFLELMTASKNALLLRVGALEIDWENKQVPSYMRIPMESLTPETLVMLQSQGAEISPIEDGSGVMAKVFQREERCRIEAVPTDELIISSDCTTMDLDRARFVGRQVLVPRSDLLAEGYNPAIVDTMAAYTTTTAQRSRAARERNTWGREKHSGDRGMDLIMTVRCYYFLDEDRDGIAERRRIVVAGSPGGWHLLDDEPYDYQPFAAGAGYLWPHQPYGISIFDKLKQVQDLKSKYWRIMLEAGQRAARDRVGLMPGTNIEDWQSSMFGGAVRMTNERGVVPIPNPQFPVAVGALQEIADKARREGGGGAVDKANQETMPVEAGAHGVERMLAAIEELNAMVARLLAETVVRQAYLKIHYVLRTWSPPIPRKNSGQWVQVDPSQWQPRKKVTVADGLTMAERNRLAQAAGAVIGNQKELLSQGSTLVNSQTMYRALMTQARYMGLKNTEGLYVDPTSQEGQMAAQQAQEAQQAAQQQQQEAAQIQAQTQAMILTSVEETRNQGKVMVEAMKGQQAQQELMAKMQESFAKLAQDQDQFQQTLAQQYDALRVQVMKIQEDSDVKLEVAERQAIKTEGDSS